MRVAVLSDIHGFDLALEVVLADIARRGPFDQVVVAGDLCEVGPAPKRALDRLRSGGYIVLLGNTDQDLIEAAKGGESTPEADFALEQIGEEGVTFLASLPRQHRVVPPGGRDASDDLLVVHANPHDLETKMTPEMTDDELRTVLGDTKAGAIAFGHHHVSFVRELDGMTLVDVSAVGNPKDGDLRCRYGILSWEPARRAWSAEIVKLDYPVNATIDQMRASGMPDPEEAITKLLRASYN
jgi:predicted phosphodiesterase